MTTDPAAIDLLLAEHSAFVERLARRLLVDSDAAADLSQETWRAVLERRPAVTGEVRAWLAGIARNLARFHRRSEASRRRREAAAARAAAEAATRPGQTEQHLQELDRLVEALRRLPEPFRSVVVMRYREGLPPRTIAARTGSPLETVKSRLKRGLGMLRADMLRAHDGDDGRLRAGLAVLVAGTGRAKGATVAALVLSALTVALAVAWLASFGPGSPDAAPQSPLAAAVLVPPLRDLDPSDTVAVRAALAPSSEAGSAVEGLRLRVVDADTGAPLPQFVVAVSALADPLVVSDEHGVLTLPATPDAALELRLIDHPRLRPERAIRGTCAGGVLRVEVGPTYRLRLGSAGALEGVLSARLVAADPDRQFRTSFAPVRISAEEAWVRFAAEASELGGGPPWRLEVRSDDGHRLGSALVGAVVGDAVVGLHPTLVEVNLQATGCLVGGVLEAGGATIDQADIVATRVGDPVAGGATERRATRSDESGTFELPWLPPGVWALRASSPRHAATETTVRVEVDATATVDLRLHALPAQGPIVGVLRSEGGDPTRAPLTGPITVVLAHQDDPEVTFVQVVAPITPASVSRDTLGTFRFDAVPAGWYSLTVHAGDFAPWSACEPVAPGGGLVQVWRRDRAATGDIEVKAVDALTGARIEVFRAFVVVDDAPASAKVVATENGVLLLHNVPLAATVRCTLRSDGYVSMTVDRAALAAPVRLTSGWGMTLRCIDAQGAPRAGVEFAADGRPAGRTDLRGELRLLAAHAPHRLTVTPDRVVVIGGDLQPDGTFQDLIWGLRVIVATAPGPRTPPIERRR